MKNKMKLLTKSSLAILTAMTLMGTITPSAQTYYTVQPGDTFYHIAQRFGVDYHDLMALNGRSSSYLNVGDPILISNNTSQAEVTSPASQNEGTSSSAGTYTVQKGDTLYDIAGAYGMSVDYLMAINGISSSYIDVGDVLAVTQGSRTSSQTPESSQPASQGNSYLVQAGDNLSSIAFAYGVSVGQLKAWNGLVTDLIYPGDKIAIVEGGSSSVSQSSTTPSPAQSSNQNPSSSAGSHSIAPGDTLYDIARNYGLSYEQLMAYNGLSSSMIYPGQVIYLPGTNNGYTPAPTSNQVTPASDSQAVQQASETPATESSEAQEGSRSTSASSNQETSRELTTSESDERTTSTNRVTRLRIPETVAKNKKDLTDPKTEALDPAKIDLITHEVKEGETLEEIVEAYDASLDDVRTWNQLLNNEVQAGDLLYLSDPSQAVTKYGQERPLKDAYPIHYLVKRNDDLEDLADLFNVKPGWIRQWSELEAEEAIEPGQELLVTHPNAKPDIYTVEAGDSLASIAEENELSVDAIREWNGLLDNVIYEGEELALSNPMPTYHQVEPGETLEVIADQYDLSIDQLREWNHLPAETMIVNGLLVVSDPKSFETDEEEAEVSEEEESQTTEEQETTQAS